MNCKNCKHFSKGYFQHSEIGPIIVWQDSKFGMCLCEKVTSDNINDWLGREPKEQSIDGLYAGCDENRGSLSVGEDFGCIHFELKK